MDIVGSLLDILQKQSELTQDFLKNNSENSVTSKNILKSKGSTFTDDNTPSRLTSTEKSRISEASEISSNIFFRKQLQKDKDVKIASSKIEQKPKTLLSLSREVYKKPKVEKPEAKKTEAEKPKTLLSLSREVYKKPKAIPIKSKPSTLEGAEKSRTLSWAKIVIGQFFDEQRRQKKDTKLKTLTSKPKGINSFGEFSSSSKKGKDDGNGKGNTSGGFLSSLAAILGAKILTSLKGVVSNVFGKPLQALKNFKTRTIKRLTPNVVRNSMAAYKRIKRNITPTKVATFIAKKSSNLASSAAGGISRAAGSVGRLASSAAGGISRAAGGISKTVSGAAGSVSKAASSAVNVVKTKTVDSAKALVKTNIKNILPSPKAIPKLFGGTLSKAPIIGPAITAAFAAYDIKGMKDKYNKGEITKDELQKDAGKRIITAITGAVGSAGGALLGGALGTLIPIPLVGTAIGSIVGALGGALAGEYLGGLISDYIIPEKYTKSIGAFFTNTEPPKEEMQDFIIKDGRIHKFNNKDELMGLKSGGAINEFLQSKPKNDSYLRLVEIGLTTNSYLMAIANNTAIMARGDKSNSAASPIIIQKTAPSPTNGTSYINIDNNRDGYASSHYSLA